MSEKPPHPPLPLPSGEPQNTGDEVQDSPLSCAVALGEYIRIEYGKQGVQEFVHSLAHLVPMDMCGQLAEQLRVETPSPPPPLYREHAPQPKRPEMGMDQLMQMMQMMQMMGKMT